jgi:hypothetical protein
VQGIGSRQCVLTRGGEFVSRESKGWLQQQGIELELSAPHSPQQNGKAERLNRVLVERARAMLAESGLPLKYWYIAVQYGNEVRNRSPYAPLGITPYEAFFGRKPDVSGLRVWGCRVFYLVVPKAARGNKFAPVALRGWFMGRDGGGYRILTASGACVVAHTVKFFEHSVTGVSGEEPKSSGSGPAAAGGSGQSNGSGVSHQPGAAVGSGVPPAGVAAGMAGGVSAGASSSVSAGAPGGVSAGVAGGVSAGPAAGAGGSGVPPAVAPLRRSGRANKGVPASVFEPEASGSRVRRQPDPPPAAVRLPVIGVNTGVSHQQVGSQQQGADDSDTFRM